MTPEEFVARWQNTTLNERQSYQTHFNDLCRMLNVPHPSGSGTDWRGNVYKFEAGGEAGFADVYLEGHFAIEYKAPHKYKDLNAAYDQLLRYREQLKNPPLLIVTDIEKWQIHTNFEGTEKRVYEFKHQDIASLQNVRDHLEAMFAEPKRLHPHRNTADVTKDAARGFQLIADNMRAWDADPARIARFLTKLVFCLFAEDIHLLPTALNSERGIFSELVHQFRSEPPRFRRYAEELFKAMASGGDVLMAQIPYFNGSLFDNIDVENLELEALTELSKVSQLNWASIEPAIFGTLFERALDKKKRAQLGAHYTSRDDILLIIEPVLMAPLRRQWADVKTQAEQLQAEYARAATPKDKININRKREALRDTLLERVRTITVLDPACGSGNFLYVALQSLMTLEKEIIMDAVWTDLTRPIPDVHPRQMFGIEKDPIAHALASIVVWIGYIQWRRNNGYSGFKQPILEDLHNNIRNMDAILTLTPPLNPLPAPQGGDLTAAATAPLSTTWGPTLRHGTRAGGGVVRPPAEIWARLKPFAREMRQNPTPTEDVLWQTLHKKQVGMYRFRRQHAIDRFIVDFYCREAHLVIELDGSIHDEPDQREYDELRQAALESLGLRVIRFRNDEVLHHLDSVLSAIQAALNPSPLIPTPNPGAMSQGWPPRRGEGSDSRPGEDASPLLAERGGVGGGVATEPEWPTVDVIVGNPPFLGDKKMRGELGGDYTTTLRKLYQGRVPGGADLVTYWFEKARAQLEAGAVKRVGLLSTNSIRGGANQDVLKRIKQTGDIFMAWADRAWILEGAAVRVSMVGFDKGEETEKTLDGKSVATVNADLTSSVNLAQIAPLKENTGIVFLGMMKAGPFDIDEQQALAMLESKNISGKSNSDVVKKRFNGNDITTGWKKGWIIDFSSMTETEARNYELPFQHIEKHVRPLRESNRRSRMKNNWWQHGESRPGLRRKLNGLQRFIATPEVSKHRIFVWLDKDVIPDHKLHVFARQDDYFFGVLHSKIHEVWSIKVGSWMGKGNDPVYASSRILPTFPFPYTPGKEPTDDPCYQAIAAAAKQLHEERQAWLTPLSTKWLRGRH